MKILIILNDPPYGNERSYNGIRMASAILKKDPATELSVFLMADAVICAKSGQKTPTGYY
ncbi:MAG: DsrE family protein, partial [Gammaproteobacteria bacterium]|nr:DsrE family protein [Gammaproteobacteria bacterium]